MKKAFLIAILCFTVAPAWASDDTIYLPGNAQVRNSSNNGSIVLRGYDTEDVIKHRILNPNSNRYRYGTRYNNRIPTNDTAAICGGIERDRKRERCVEDVMKERQKLMKKYND